jgi:hypothetical protein
MYDIKWVKEADTSKSYVCPVCQAEVEYTYLGGDEPDNYAWFCNSCFSTISDPPHLEIQL